MSSSVADLAWAMQDHKADLSNSVQSLVECLEITMIQHPLLSLRNMAFWSLDALLNALQVMYTYNLDLLSPPVIDHSSALASSTCAFGVAFKALRISYGRAVLCYLVSAGCD